jgi:hypothetical protein
MHRLGDVLEALPPEVRHLKLKPQTLWSWPPPTPGSAT